MTNAITSFTKNANKSNKTSSSAFYPDWKKVLVLSERLSYLLQNEGSIKAPAILSYCDSIWGFWGGIVSSIENNWGLTRTGKRRLIVVYFPVFCSFMEHIWRFGMQGASIVKTSGTNVRNDGFIHELFTSREKDFRFFANRIQFGSYSKGKTVIKIIFFSFSKEMKTYFSVCL